MHAFTWLHCWNHLAWFYLYEKCSRCLVGNLRFHWPLQIINNLIHWLLCVFVWLCTFIATETHVMWITFSHLGNVVDVIAWSARVQSPFTNTSLEFQFVIQCIIYCLLHRYCILDLETRMPSRHLLLQNTVVSRLSWPRILRWVSPTRPLSFWRWTPLGRYNIHQLYLQSSCV